MDRLQTLSEARKTRTTPLGKVKSYQFPSSLFLKAKPGQVSKLSKSYFGVDFVKMITKAIEKTVKKEYEFPSSAAYENDGGNFYLYYFTNKGEMSVSFDFDGEEYSDGGLHPFIPGVPKKVLEHIFKSVLQSKYGKFVSVSGEVDPGPPPSSRRNVGSIHPDLRTPEDYGEYEVDWGEVDVFTQDAAVEVRGNPAGVPAKNVTKYGKRFLKPYKK